MNDWLKYEKNGSVVTLTMNRPDIRNPLGEPEDVINFEASSKLVTSSGSPNGLRISGLFIVNVTTEPFFSNINQSFIRFSP